MKHVVQVWLGGGSGFIHADGPHGRGSIPERCLPYNEAPLLLPHLSPKCLLLEVRKLQLVEDPADLDTKLCFLIFRIEAVRDGNHADTVEVKFRRGESILIVIVDMEYFIAYYNLQE